METTTKMLTIDPSTPILPSWANAAVYFVREAGEYIFAARKDDRTISKFLRPADVKAAFTHQEDRYGMDRCECRENWKQLERIMVHLSARRRENSHLLRRRSE